MFVCMYIHVCACTHTHIPASYLGVYCLLKLGVGVGIITVVESQHGNILYFNSTVSFASLCNLPVGSN